MSNFSIDFPVSSYKDWYEKAIKTLKNSSFEELKSTNSDNITIEAYYNSENTKSTNFILKNQNCNIITPYYPSFENDVNGFIFTNEIQTNIESDKKVFYDFSSHSEINTLSRNDKNQIFILNDLFTEYEKNGKWTHSLADNLSVFSKQNKKLNMCVDISLHQNAGATISQQIAYFLSKVNELVGFFGPEILKNILVKTAIGSDFFTEIAKLKVLRILFQKIAEEYKIEAELHIFCETTFRNKSTIDKENNLIRSSLESISAIIGGANFLSIQPYQNWNNPTEQDWEIAYKQFLVLSHESMLNFFDDATSNAYFIENLTSELAQKSWKLFQNIENENGYLYFLESGKLKSEIEKALQEEIDKIESNEIILIGINESKSDSIGFEFNDSQNSYLSPKRLAQNYEQQCKRQEK